MKNLKTPKSLDPSLLNRQGNIPIAQLPNGKYQLTIIANGKKYRPQFRSYDEALDKWKKVKKVEISYGKKALEYDHNAHREYQEANRILGGQMSISELARKHRELIEIAGNEDLTQVAVFYRNHKSDIIKETPSINEAVDIFKTHYLSRNLSSYYMKDLNRLNALKIHFDSKKISQINSNDILHLLLTMKKDPVTIHNHYRTFSVFFNYSQRRRWIIEAPTIYIRREEDLPKIYKKPKAVFTLEQTQAMMRFIETNYPKYSIFIALQAFAGLRVEEVTRFGNSDHFLLDWINLDERQIIIPAHICKTNDDWVMKDLPENLWNWILAYAGNKPIGNLIHPQSSKQLTKIRKEIVSLSEFTEKKWPKNGLRHTFCTMHISLLGDAAKTATLLRHSNINTLRKHYEAKLVPTRVAQEYFSIVPELQPKLKIA